MGPLKGFRPDQIPLGEIVSRVGGQQQFKAACLEHVLAKAMEDVRRCCGGREGPGRSAGEGVSVGRGSKKVGAAGALALRLSTLLLLLPPRTTSRSCPFMRRACCPTAT